MSIESQNAAILKHLQSRGSITTYTAFKRYGVTRLPARIPELERQGHEISNVWVKRNGKRFKAWSLAHVKQARVA